MRLSLAILAMVVGVLFVLPASSSAETSTHPKPHKVKRHKGKKHKTG